MREQKKIPLSQLSNIFNVSEMTIRRDIKLLESHNIATLVQGILYLNESQLMPGNTNNDYFVIQQKNIHSYEKNKIARQAAKLIKPGDSIIIDVGTTTSQIINHLPKSYPISILCFTVNTLLEALKINCDNLLFMGGVYHSNNQLFESNETLNLLKRTRASIAFISAAGVSDTLGITCVNPEEVAIKITAMQNTLKKVLLVDSSKFNVVRHSYFAELSDFDAIITDSLISTEWQNLIHSRGIKLYIV